MGALIVIGTAVAGILLAAIASQLASEFRDWTLPLTDWLINRAVRRLPSKLQDRMVEEWRQFVSDTPGHIAKVLRAAGLGLAAKRVALEFSGVGLFEHAGSRAMALATLISLAPIMILVTLILVLRGGPVFEKTEQNFYQFRTSDDAIGRTLARFAPLPTLWNFARGDTPLRWGSIFAFLWRILLGRPNSPE
jgi:hypothetical protein